MPYCSARTTKICSTILTARLQKGSKNIVDVNSGARDGVGEVCMQPRRASARTMQKQHPNHVGRGSARQQATKEYAPCQIRTGGLRISIL
jgi:hypothetical protein